METPGLKEDHISQIPALQLMLKNNYLKIIKRLTYGI